MTRFMWLIICVLVVGSLAASSVLADPLISKRVVSSPDGTSMVIIKVLADVQDIYGIAIENSQNAFEDIEAPRGWVAIASSDQALFRTESDPITPGDSMSFVIVASDWGVDLSVIFRGKRGFFGKKQNI